METIIEHAEVRARELAHGLGVRVFLYQDAAGNPIYRAIQPSLDRKLKLVGEYAASPGPKYEGNLRPMIAPADDTGTP